MVFKNLADKVLSKDNSWEQYRAFLKFMLITDSGNIEKFLNCSTDTRFAKLWTDKYNNDTLSSMIKVLPEDKLQIKIIDEMVKLILMKDRQDKRVQRFLPSY